MVELSEALLDQVIAWSAAGGTPHSILVRISDDNRDDTGLAPWPAELTEHDIVGLLEEHQGERLALYGQRLLSRTTLGGLAGRAAQASAAIDRLLELDRQIRLFDQQLERLVRGGAFAVTPFIEEQALDHENSVYAETFGRAPRSEDGGRAVILVREGGARYRVETSALAIGDALLKRAALLGKHLVALRQVGVKEAELLSKVTGHGISRQPMPEEGFGLE